MRILRQVIFLILLIFNYLPVEQYVEKGILEDLTRYLEKDDVVNKDDIIPSVREGNGDRRKALLYSTKLYTAFYLIASKKDVGDKTGWTFEELKELLEEKGEGVRPFYRENKSRYVRQLPVFMY